MNTRAVKFHPTHSLGKLYLSEHNLPGDWVEYLDAQGEVLVPPGMNLILRVTNDGLTDLTPLTHLEPDDLYAIDFACTHVKDDDLRFVRSLTHLNGLAIWETNIGDLALAHLSGMASIRWLDIGDTKITDEGLAHLRGLNGLQSLTLLNDEIGDNGVTHLAGFESLLDLDLMSTRVSDASITLLSGLTGMQSLRIYQTRISENGYAELSRALPGCQIWYYRSNNL
jgi:internalin A